MEKEWPGTWQDDQHREVRNGERQSQGQDSRACPLLLMSLGVMLSVWL